jgi:hypothetical protein
MLETWDRLASARRCLNGSAAVVDRLAVQELEIAAHEAAAAIEGLTA